LQISVLQVDFPLSAEFTRN